MNGGDGANGGRHPGAESPLRRYRLATGECAPRLTPGCRFEDRGTHLPVRRLRLSDSELQALPAGIGTPRSIAVDGGFGTFTCGAPPGDLTQAVDQWITSEGVEAGGSFALSMMRIPDGTWTLWHEEVLDERGRVVDHVLSFGGGMAVATRPSHHRLGRCTVLILAPWVCPHLVGVPLHELSQQRWHADALIGADGAAALARLGETRELGARLAVLFDLVRRRLRTGDEAARMARMLAGMGASLRTDRISAIARELALSPRSLERLFQVYAGQPPKAHQGALRLREAVEVMERGNLPLVEVAFHAGYSDQAHFTRDCRARVGVPPAVLRDLLRRGVRTGAYRFLPAAIVPAD